MGSYPVQVPPYWAVDHHQVATVGLESSVWLEPPLMEVELLQAAVTKNIDKNLVKLLY